MQDREVVVIGGGSTGCSILYHLAKAGVKDSLLLDMGGQLAGGQTSRSTALVRTHYSTETLTRMALASYRFFKSFGRELPGRTAGYVETGLVVGADEASVGPLRENSSMHRRLGIDSRLMEPGEFQRSGIEPVLEANAFSLFAYEPNSGYAEPSTTASSFASAAVELGSKTLTGVRATGIAKGSSGGGQPYTVTTTAGEVRCRRVVLATGVWSKPLFAGVGIELPLRVSRHPVAIYGRSGSYLGTRPVLFDFPRSAYYKPEGRDRLFVGSLAPELDSSAAEADPDDFNQNISFEEAEGFSESLAAAIPFMSTSGTYHGGYAGLYDNTPDQSPIIDEFSSHGLDGLFCVVGLSGHGFKLSPEFGRIIAALVVDGRFTDYDVSVFRLRRFAEGRSLRGRYRVSTIS